MTEQKPVDLADAPLATQEWVLQAINVLDTVWQKMSGDLEERMETTDKVLAEFTLAYAKLSSLVEALIVLNVTSPENEKKFRKALDESMQKMKDTLDHGQEDSQVDKQRFHPTGAIVDDESDPQSEPPTS